MRSTLGGTVAEQKLDETAAHIRALCVESPNWSGALRGLIGVDHSRLVAGPRFDRVRLIKCCAQTSRARDERNRHSFEHRRTLYFFAVSSARFEGPNH